MSGKIEGGCMCGAIRYELDGEVEVVAHCHCAMCRRSTGAPVVTWAVLPRANFRVTKGSMKIYRSSEKGERMFCPDCGTQLVFQTSDNPDKLDVSLGSLDDPDGLTPSCHVGVSGRLNCMKDLGAELPVA